MNKLILSIALMMLPIASMAETEQMYDQAPAFPGAEGLARYTTKGGRGYNVVHVTNLNDSGTGSFRSAVSGGNRIIVFDVSGYIDLKSEIKISSSNITIAGQTAPGDGITLRYYTVTYAGNNIITRFIRFRRSQIKDVNDGADAAWGRNKSNIIFDHCSFSWSIDELASFYDNKNFTMQWCTLGEALANPGHSKGEHSYGGIWGGKDASFHHNMLCHMQNRVPRFNGARYNWTGYDNTKYKNTIDAERVDFRNCVMYNWGNGNGCYGGPGGGYVNIVNNYYKAGPATANKTRVTQVSVSDASNGGDNPFPGIASRYYINGNYVTAAGSNAANYDWSGVIYDNGLTTNAGDKWIPDPNHFYGSHIEYTNISGKDHVRVRLDEPIDGGDVTTHTAEMAYEKVLSYAGASYARDAIDARYMEEARTGTTTYKGTVSNRAGIIDLIQDPSAATVNSALVAYPELQAEQRPSTFDTDRDGMPDEWEVANGLDPNSSADGKTYTLDPKGWYTNVECYINSLVEHIVRSQNEDAISAVDEYYPELAGSNSIAQTQTSAQSIRRVEYYDLLGKQIAEPSGICIRKIIWEDGSCTVDKVKKN